MVNIRVDNGKRSCWSFKMIFKRSWFSRIWWKWRRTLNNGEKASKNVAKNDKEEIEDLNIRINRLKPNYMKKN